MSMTMYAIYDPATGEVVHLHAEPAELDSSPEEILSIADVRNPQRLRAIRLSAQETAAGGGRVVDGELRAEEAPNWGQAGAERPGDEPKLERRYHPQPPAGTSG